jgi:hypothetical protein
MADGKTPELSYVQTATGVVANDAAAHDEDADGLSRINQLAEIDFPSALAFFDIDA